MNQFEQIFQKYYHPLYLYGLKFIINGNDVDDIIQEVFTEVWEKKKYTLSPSHIKSYLFASVRNSCYNFLRHQSVIKKHTDQKAGLHSIEELHYYNNVETSLIEQESLSHIYSVINSLPIKHKEIIELSRFQGLKNKEIAKLLNIPIRTVETRLFRALKTLRNNLSNEQIILLIMLTKK